MTTQLKGRFAVLLVICLLPAVAARREKESYIHQFGNYRAIADRLARLVGAEEPLQHSDITRLVATVRRSCGAGNSGSTQYQLVTDDLVKQYSPDSGFFDQRALEQACSAIMACQIDETCSFGDATDHLQDLGSTLVTNTLRVVAAAALFFEGLLGVYIPVMLTSVEGYEWWLSLLNCFSGGVFLTAGLVHLLPHCAEAQSRLGSWVGDYPLYLVLITLGYVLVLFVERVLFDVHGDKHGHGPHTGIAPPCITCRTAEEAAHAAELLEANGFEEALITAAATADGAAEGQLSQGTAAAEADQLQGVTDVDGVGGVPGIQSRYNLRNRTGNTPAWASRGAAAAAADVDSEHKQPLLDGSAAGDTAGAPQHAHQASHHQDGTDRHRSSSSGQMSDSRDHQHHHHRHRHGHGHVAPFHHHAVVVGDLRQGAVLLVAMAVHTFLECMALGLMNARREFFMLFMAIASHKLISGLALSSRFLKEGATTLQITMYVGPFAFVAPCAILVGIFVRDVNPIVHLALSCFATGTFLYVGASEIVEEEFEGDMRSGRTDISQVIARWCKFGMLLLGVVAIAGLSFIPDAHDHGGVHHSHCHHHHHH